MERLRSVDGGTQVKVHLASVFRDPNNDHGNKKEKRCAAFGASEYRVVT